MKIVTVKRQYIRTLILLVIFISYLFAGSAIFHAIESQSENDAIDGTEKVVRELKANYSLSDEDFANIVNIIRTHPYIIKTERKWNFTQALFFATTVVTTIGYGVSAPSTNNGKGVCIIYALFGIPITILLYQSVGDIINAFFAYVIRKVKLRIGKSASVQNLELGLIDSILISSYFCGGAAAFSLLENWTYLEGFYYCFVTLSTIGFGDYVALQKHNIHMDYTTYLAFCIIFIMLGLAVVSSGLNLFIRFTMEITTTDQSKRDSTKKSSSDNDTHTNCNGRPTPHSSIKTNVTVVHDTTANTIFTTSNDRTYTNRSVSPVCDRFVSLNHQDDTQHNDNDINNGKFTSTSSKANYNMTNLSPDGDRLDVFHWPHDGQQQQQEQEEQINYNNHDIHNTSTNGMPMRHFNSKSNNGILHDNFDNGSSCTSPLETTCDSQTASPVSEDPLTTINFDVDFDRHVKQHNKHFINGSTKKVRIANTDDILVYNQVSDNTNNKKECIRYYF